jgi:ribosomal protein L37E
MVIECDNCGERAFATRFKDSYLSFCRECGFYTEPKRIDGQMQTTEGFLEDDEFERLREKYPIKG